MSIVLGADELILYVRKHNPGCQLEAKDLEKKIVENIKSLDPNANIVAEDKASYWSLGDVMVIGKKLPRTSAQIEFDREILPKVY